jgi:hypothetical protein
MKILSALTAALFVCVLVVSCSSPGTTNPPPNPASSPFTVAATIDGVQYTAGATMTIATISSMYFVDVKSTSGSQSFELLFRFPTNSTFTQPLHLNQSTNFTATYNEGAASFTDSAGTATVTVNSFSYSYADTTFSADFVFKAKGGSGTLSVKNFTAGTVRHN